ncbi:unnamed protein product, partial [Mesorhabditis spiculigera]
MARREETTTVATTTTTMTTTTTTAATTRRAFTPITFVPTAARNNCRCKDVTHLDKPRQLAAPGLTNPATPAAATTNCFNPYSFLFACVSSQAGVRVTSIFYDVDNQFAYNVTHCSNVDPNVGSEYRLPCVRMVDGPDAYFVSPDYKHTVLSFACEYVGDSTCP